MARLSKAAVIKKNRKTVRTTFQRAHNCCTNKKITIATAISPRLTVRQGLTLHNFFWQMKSSFFSLSALSLPYHFLLFSSYHSLITFFSSYQFLSTVLLSLAYHLIDCSDNCTASNWASGTKYAVDKVSHNNCSTTNIVWPTNRKPINVIRIANPNTDPNDSPWPTVRDTDAN